MENNKRRVQFFIAFSIAMGPTTFGAYSGWLTVVMPKFTAKQTTIELTDTDISWLVALSSLGFMFGGLFMQTICDRFGRRVAILAGIIPFLSMLIVLFSSQQWPLYIARFVWGVGGGMSISVTNVYLAEIADKEIRGHLSTIPRYMYYSGSLFTLAAGPFLSYTALNYVLLMYPLVAFLACWWIPESPFYCLKVGKIDAARNVLSRIREYENDKVLEDDLSNMKLQVRNEMRRSGSVKELLTDRRYRKAVLLSIGLKLSQILSGQLVIQQYLGLIVQESQANIDLSTVFLVFGGLRFIVCVMSSMVVDKIGRRPLLIYTFLGTGVSLGIISIYFFLLEVVKMEHSYLKPYGFIPFAGIVLSSIISTLGYTSILNFMLAELFPLNVRAVSAMVISIFGGFINFTIARAYQVTKDFSGLSGVFGIYCIASLAGSLLSYTSVPETKGKSLREIQIELQGDLYEDNEEVEKLNPTKDIEKGTEIGQELHELVEQNEQHKACEITKR